MDDADFWTGKKKEGNKSPLDIFTPPPIEDYYKDRPESGGMNHARAAVRFELEQTGESLSAEESEERARAIASGRRRTHPQFVYKKTHKRHGKR